ncbi:MAG: c-type cytochrome [Gammaproteobacteria bacterium]|jgi:sulfide dehydrogenase cytochrome subunit|nr:c-type cytochrome [Gammaproteobacteria bacterium]
MQIWMNKWLMVFITAVLFSGIGFAVHADEELDALVKKCGMCHGMDGNSPSAGIPSIAGIPEDYFRHTMDAYKNGGRQSELMKSFVHDLSEAEIRLLSDYYLKQTYKPMKQEFDAEKAKQGQALHNKYCIKCHENNGKISVNNYGILAGQGMAYLRQALQDYLDKKRRVNPMMITKLQKLIDAEGQEGIDKLVNFYASVK